MNKLFEVPYNFNETLISFYKKHSSYISYLFLPPYKDDLINTRTSIETKKKGRCYMPQSREEYEYHLRKIKDAGLNFVVLWQVFDNIISLNLLNYYCGLGAAGFIVANDKNAMMVKEYNSDLIVVCSIVQRICSEIRNKEFSCYDQIILYYPFNRSLNALKRLSYIKDKIIIMPNTLCHIECPSIHHWFPSKDQPFVQERDCMVLRDNENYISKCGFVSPEHLHLFDNYVGGYKLQGREYTTDMIKYICQLYFDRKSPKNLLDTLLGSELSTKIHDKIHSMSLDEYYNTKTQDVLQTL